MELFWVTAWLLSTLALWSIQSELTNIRRALENLK